MVKLKRYGVGSGSRVAGSLRTAASTAAGGVKAGATKVNPIALASTVKSKLKRPSSDPRRSLTSADPRLQKQLQEALSNQNWGCSNTVLYEIASQTDFQLGAILETINKTLDEKDRNWRRAYKALNLIEACLKHGHGAFHEAMRSESWRIMKWTDFRYQEGGKDVGAGVRDKVQLLLKLINDPAFLDKERTEARKIAEKMNRGAIGASSFGSTGFGGGSYGGANFGSSYGGGGYGGTPRVASRDTRDHSPGNLGGLSALEQSEKATQFCSITGATYFDAKRILAANNYNLEESVSVFLEEKRNKRGGVGTGDTAGGGFKHLAPPKRSSTSFEVPKAPSAAAAKAGNLFGNSRAGGSSSSTQPTQKEKIEKVAGVCSVTNDVAEQLLKKHEWSIDAACNAFFSGDAPDASGIATSNNASGFATSNSTRSATAPVPPAPREELKPKKRKSSSSRRLTPESSDSESSADSGAKMKDFFSFPSESFFSQQPVAPPSQQQQVTPYPYPGQPGHVGAPSGYPGAPPGHPASQMQMQRPGYPPAYGSRGQDYTGPPTSRSNGLQDQLNSQISATSNSLAALQRQIQQASQQLSQNGLLGIQNGLMLGSQNNLLGAQNGQLGPQADNNTLLAHLLGASNPNATVMGMGNPNFTNAMINSGMMNQDMVGNANMQSLLVANGGMMTSRRPASINNLDPSAMNSILSNVNTQNQLVAATLARAPQNGQPATNLQLQNMMLAHQLRESQKQLLLTQLQGAELMKSTVNAIGNVQGAEQRALMNGNDQLNALTKSMVPGTSFGDNLAHVQNRNLGGLQFIQPGMVQQAGIQGGGLQQGMFQTGSGQQLPRMAQQQVGMVQHTPQQTPQQLSEPSKRNPFLDDDGMPNVRSGYPPGYASLAPNDPPSANNPNINPFAPFNPMRGVGR